LWCIVGNKGHERQRYLNAVAQPTGKLTGVFEATRGFGFAYVDPAANIAIATQPRFERQGNSTSSVVCYSLPSD
jgi:hypothetical protein